VTQIIPVVMWDYRKWWILVFIYVLVFFSRIFSYFASKILKNSSRASEGTI